MLRDLADFEQPRAIARMSLLPNAPTSRFRPLPQGKRGATIPTMRHNVRFVPPIHIQDFPNS
jgi:hypothetical protein